MKILNKIISFFKSEEFQLDQKIPLSYICLFLLEKIFSFVRGFFIFRSLKKRFFVGRYTKIRCAKKISIVNNISFSRNCYVDALSINGIVTGENFSLGKFSIIECTGTLKEIGYGLRVGDNVGVGTNCYLGCAGGVDIGDDTIIGNYVSFHSENHNFSIGSEIIRKQGVSRLGINVGKNCWIGAKATILDGVVLEDNCVVAAGSVLKKGIYKNNCLYAGVPAKFIKKI